VLAAAQTGGGTAGKSHWLAKVLKAYDGRSAIEATVEPSAVASCWDPGWRAATSP